eukprot:Sspe_Gene.84948::Locus_55782_Transcript_2_2_Confidence_0.500_Length_1825::g.84948::m.84948/K14803/PTC2_3; protein phosphatase PTC2/3
MSRKPHPIIIGECCIGTSPPISPPADDARARAARARSYTSLTSPVDVAARFSGEPLSRLHQPADGEEADKVPDDELRALVNPPEGGSFESLNFNTLFRKCCVTSKRPADRLFIRSWKAFSKKAAEQHYKQNPHDFIAVCYDISDYGECFWNYKCNRFCYPSESEHFDEILEALFTTKGSFLDDPVTEKETIATLLTGGLPCCSTSMQGWRSDNEDTLSIVPSLPRHPTCSFIAVFDGHGGSRVAEFTSKKLASAVDTKLPDSLDKHDAVKEALHSAFIETDEKVEREMNPDHTGATGTTCNAALITPDSIIVANTGDSRCVLACGGGAKRLSEDHKPENPTEMARIKGAGGEVTADGRVDGLLAVSRAFGDYDFKQAGSLSLMLQAVTPAPDVTFHRRSPSDEFLIQACDGIWDCMSDEEVCEFLRNEFKGGKSIKEAIEALCDACLAPQLEEGGIGLDNMTVTCVLLQPRNA